MGIFGSILIYGIIYIYSFKEDFDEENRKELASLMFGIAIVVAVGCIIGGIVGRK